MLVDVYDNPNLVKIGWKGADMLPCPLQYGGPVDTPEIYAAANTVSISILWSLTKPLSDMINQKVYLTVEHQTCCICLNYI